jgi:hypothetical protein
VQGLRDALNGAEITADMVAPSTLGEKCWVRWPYLQVRLPWQPQPRVRPCHITAICRGHQPLPRHEEFAAPGTVVPVVSCWPLSLARWASDG